MRLLDRYIFREILVPTAIGLVALTFVFFSREIGRLLEILINQSASFSELGQLAAAIMPGVMTFSLPMALLIGILTGFGRMSSDNEMIALRAAGISMRRISRPVLILACITWLVNLGLTTGVAPAAAARLRVMKREIALKQGALEIQPGVFNEGLSNFVLYVGARRGLEWRSIMLSN